MTYSLTIHRYGRYMTFDTLDELKAELATYFTQREKDSGIVDRLTRFTMETVTDNYGSYRFAQNDYQDYQICAYED